MKIQLLSLSYYLFYAATTATTTTTAAAASKTVSATTSVVVVAKAVGSKPNSLIAAAIAAVSVSVSVSAAAAAAAAPFILTVPYSFTTGTINPYLGCSRCNRYRENREHRLQRLQKTTLQLQRTSTSSTSTAKKRKTRRPTFWGDSCSFIHPTTTFATRRLKGHYLRSSSPLVSFLSSKSSSSLSSLLSAEQEQNRIYNNNNNDDDDTTIVGASTTKKSEQERPQEEDDCDGLYRPFAEWGWEKILSTFPKFDDDHNDDGNNNTNNTNNNEQPYVEEIYIDPEFSMTLSTPTPIPISTSSNNTNTTTSTTSTAVRITIRALKGCSTGAATTTNKKTSCPIRYARYALLETVHIRTMQDNDDKIEQHDKMMDYTNAQQTTLSGGEKGIQQKYLSSKGTTATTTTIKTGIQVLNMVIFPSIDSDLPVWGADFVTLPGNKNLILLDAQPMNIVTNNNNNMNNSKNNTSEETSNSNSSVDNSSKTENSTMSSASTSTSSYSDRWDEWYLEHINKNRFSSSSSSSSTRVLFPWGGDLPEQVQQYVSKNALWTRMNYYNTNNPTTAGDSTGSSNNSNSNSATIPSASNVTAIIEGPLYKAFQDHLQIYVDTLQDWKKETEKQQLPKQTQKQDQAFYPRHHHHHHHQQQQQQQQQEQEQHLDNSTSTCNKQSMYVQYRLENDPARPMLNRY